MTPGDLRRDFPRYYHADYEDAPGDLRRAFWWETCLHGRRGWEVDDCPLCEAQQQVDRALAWGVTAGALALVAFVGVLVLLLRWVEG